MARRSSKKAADAKLAVGYLRVSTDGQDLGPRTLAEALALIQEAIDART